MEIRRIYQPEVIEVVTPESETFDLIGLSAEQLALITLLVGYCAGESSRYCSDIYHAGRAALGIEHKERLFSYCGYNDYSHTHVVKRGNNPEQDRIRVDLYVINNVLSGRKVPKND